MKYVYGRQSVTIVADFPLVLAPASRATPLVGGAGVKMDVVDLDPSTPAAQGAAAQDSEITRDEAETYASWFQSLADPTRILILDLLAVEARDMPVGEISAAVRVAQPTASHHLKILHSVGFLRRRRAGQSVLYGLNTNCLTRFPTAAQTIMGHRPSPGVGQRPRHRGHTHRTVTGSR